MKFVKSRLFRLIVTILSFSLVVSLSRSILSIWKKRDIVHERERALVKVQEENSRLQQTLQDVQRQEYIERVARDKLGLIREGEAVILMINDTSTNLQMTNEETQNQDVNLPNWEKWWRLFY